MNEEEQRHWKFSGRVLPERVAITFPLTGEVRKYEAGVQISFAGAIHASQIAVSVGVIPATTDVFTVRNAVEDYVRLQLDVLGFFRGISLDVDIITAQAEDGEWRIFGPEIPVLFNNSAGPIFEVEARFMNVALRDPAVAMMLADFREAMRVPIQTGFFCYRSVEACMQSFARRTRTSGSVAWKTMRESLRLDVHAIYYVKERADWARHGKHGSISDAERATIYQFTKGLIGRYLEYADRGYLPLTEEDHSLLRIPGAGE